MKISIVTVSYNAVSSIKNAILSVINQDYADVEHIIIDGASNDGTVELIESYSSKINIFVTEKDFGIYDALNKGFTLATGDVVGILHSDDTFYDNGVLSNVMNTFINYSCDYVYGDVEMIDAKGKVRRYFKVGNLKSGKIVSKQIPHPGLFLSRRVVDNLEPVFDPKYKIAADLKQQLIFANVLHAEGRYMPSPVAKMRIGGTSTANALAYFEGWLESRKAWNEVHGHGGLFYVLRKLLYKLSGVRLLCISNR